MDRKLHNTILRHNNVPGREAAMAAAPDAESTLADKTAGRGGAIDVSNTAGTANVQPVATALEILRKDR